MPEQNGIWIVTLLELFRTTFLCAELSISDSSGLISRPGTQYLNSWTQTFDWYNLLHLTWIGVEIFSFSTGFAHYSSSSSSTSKKLEPWTENLNWELEIEDRSLRSSYGWIESNTVNECLQRKLLKNLQIYNQSSSCQRRSLHDFQTLHFIIFICDWFGCKLWLQIKNLQLIQNHTRHCF